MKPHELIQRRRQQRGAKAAPPQMRARNAAAAAGTPGAAVPHLTPDDPRNHLPARRPTFPGETRAQELERQRAAAPVFQTGPQGGRAAPPPGAPHTVTGPAAQQPPPNAHTITMCACPSDHDGGDCDNVATLRLAWPMFTEGAGQAPQGVILDVCEVCADGIKSDPIGELVTGLQIWALQPPMHGDLTPEEDDTPPVALAFECPRCGAKGGDALGAGCTKCLEMVPKSERPAVTP